jgi:hypothetical protein
MDACKRNRFISSVRQPAQVITLLVLAAALSGCSSMMHYGFCMVARGIDTHFEPEPNVVLPSTHFSDLQYFGSLDRVPWPYQKVGVIKVYNCQSKNPSQSACQESLDQAVAMARTIGGDGLVFPSSWVDCDPSNPGKTGVMFHAILIRKVPLPQTPDLDHPANR